MSFLKNLFKNNHNDTPLAERDIIETPLEIAIDPTAWRPLNWNIPSRMVNFQYILKNGKIPTEHWAEDFYSNIYDLADRASFWKEKYTENANMHINLSKDDLLNQTLNDLFNTITKELETDAIIIELLEKETWNLEDRTNWEIRLSTWTSEQIGKEPGLDKLRKSYEENPYIRTKNLNKLSEDIGKEEDFQYEYGSKQMAILEGILIQRLENSFLPEEPVGGENDFKRGGNYFYKEGYANTPISETLEAHAYIVSSVSGHIIEPTAKSNYNALRETKTNGNTLEILAKNGHILTKIGTVYGGWNMTLEDAQALRKADQEKTEEPAPKEPQTPQETAKDALTSEPIISEQHTFK